MSNLKKRERERERLNKSRMVRRGADRKKKKEKIDCLASLRTGYAFVDTGSEYFQH